MKFCQPHWDMLRAEVTAQGLSMWVTTDAATAGEQLVDAIRRGEHTRVNFDPLMHAHNMILQRSLEIAGIRVLTADFGCPVCEFNTRRTPDGVCLCGRDDCRATTPGSIPNFESWLVGPTSAVAASKAYMAQKGWLTTDAEEPTP